MSIEKGLKKQKASMSGQICNPVCYQIVADLNQTFPNVNYFLGKALEQQLVFRQHLTLAYFVERHNGVFVKICFIFFRKWRLEKYKYNFGIHTEN